MAPSTSTTAAQPGPSGQAAAAASEIKDHFNTLEDLTNFLVTEKEQGAKSNLLTRTYPANVASLNKAIFKDVDVFKTVSVSLFITIRERSQSPSQDQNYSLVRQVIDRAPRWLIKKSTSTYLTLDLADISKQVGLEAEVVRSVVLSMVRTTPLVTHDVVPIPSSSWAHVGGIGRHQREHSHRRHGDVCRLDAALYKGGHRQGVAATTSAAATSKAPGNSKARSQHRSSVLQGSCVLTTLS